MEGENGQAGGWGGGRKREKREMGKVIATFLLPLLTSPPSLLPTHTFCLGDSGELLLVGWVKLLGGHWFQLMTVLSGGPHGSRGVATRAEEGVEPHPAILQEGVVECIHTRNPFLLREGERERERKNNEFVKVKEPLKKRREGASEAWGGGMVEWNKDVR